METKALIRILREVPETNLRLIELAREITKDDGDLDYDRLPFVSGELQEAVSEAKGYAGSTQRTVWALKQMARS